METRQQQIEIEHENLEDLVAAVVARLGTQAAPLLPLLHQIQAQLGHIPPDAVAHIAEALNLSRAEVHGVISFYHFFRSTPAGEHTIQLCRAEACQAAGAKTLEQHIRRCLKTDYHQTSKDGRFSLEPVYCLGNCACSPSLRIGNKVYSEVSEAKFDALIAQLTDADESTQLPDTQKKGSVTLFIPRDTSACARGADEIALTAARSIQEQNLDLRIVRNGSRGLYWLEPLVEVEIEGERHGFGPLDTQGIQDLLADYPWQAIPKHPCYLGKVEDLPYLAKQQRVTFSRVGIIDPLSIEDYKEHGGFQGLKAALTRSAQQIVDDVKNSGLRGRGGAAFPTGIKWQTVLDAPGTEKYIVCNADEGDSGTFSDRMLMESDPFCLIEGMIIAGLATGAETGFIYLREEYPLTKEILEQAIDLARENGYLGESLMGQAQGFNIELRIGAGAYICGEETAMLESLESKRGEIRPKPPLPAVAGLFGKPSVINNVISLAAVPGILALGPECYHNHGTGKSRGTLPFQLAGNIKQGGLVELPFGFTLRELLQDFGGGSRSGRPLRAVQVGGPLGAYLPESQWDTALDYEAFAAIGAMLGHGGIVAFDDSVDMLAQARFSMEFCAHESCGKCTPCRIGSVRGVELIDHIKEAGDNARERAQYIDLLEELCDTMKEGSLCAMGGLTPSPVRSALQHFSADFGVQDVAEKGSAEESAAEEAGR